MNHRYKVRIFESNDGSGSLEAGTVVSPIDRDLLLYAASAQDVERRISKDVIDGKLVAGRIYQVCPAIGNPEVIRSIAVSYDGAKRVFLDQASNSYSEFRRLRYESRSVERKPILEREAANA
jgi:hypothetical protein